jgi:bis(5'-nucleosyl)-tetraphosphatase (symmetrical)
VIDYENYLIVHAGIYPHWTIAQSIDLSKKVHEELIAEPEKFLFKMYGNDPGFWSEDLDNFLKLRMTINIMTRMRMLNSDLSLEYNYKGEISKINHDKFQPKPWFDFKRLDSSKKIITGHWSAINICRHLYGISIDSGCVWGNALTAFCLETQELFQVPAHPDDLII